jgi:uncharacterized membrane protein (DUF4010 family)
MSFDLHALERIAIALLGGLAVGIERQWSGKADGPRARFAGLRTFTLLGLVAGLSGWLWTAGLTGPALVLLAGVGALVVVAYLAASRHDIEGTTEVAAFVVLAAGVLSGAGYTAVSSGIIAVTVFLLVEKKQLHRLVKKLDVVELRAGARFAVMAAVIMPLLPAGPYGPLGGVRPRFLWALVLFFSGLSFVGYMATRGGIGSRGYALAGAVGGLVSSTSVTLTFARLSQRMSDAGRALAAGTLGACAVLLPRVLIASAVLAPALTLKLWPAFVAPVVIGLVFFVIGLGQTNHSGKIEEERNPLQFRAALEMAAIFQLVLWISAYAKQRFGGMGLVGTGALLGLVDMDALTISMAQQTAAGTPAEVASQAVIVGVFANTIVKLLIALGIGRGTFRAITAVGLALMALALGAWAYWSLQS